MHLECVFRVPLLATVVAAVVLLKAGAAEEGELALGVRTTEPLPPAEQQGKFRLPPGFEIQLVAAEPDIHKPMNLAFDATGRLWVTTSIEYPWAAPTNRPGRDRLMIFEDFGSDGRARKITQFADGLNIPIGVYPFRRTDGHWNAVVWSIPSIWLFEDTDGDGTADRRTPIYGPFDVTRDTHGNQASFRRGFDGWLYCTHGFNNDSHVTARDGSHVDLNSGNTYRIRLDGSRIEQHTHGQVNPFGLTWDANGNLYSSDCHSAPIYQLLSGGWYPSFGKPHDGLGYAPVMLEHAHGSTAIDGALYYNDDLWPADCQDMFLIGNVMTSRLNRDRISFIGSTPKATEQPDFLTSTDPWFRPVDTTLGPDGALYVADFYNRIIGHYEVPLTHPGRDRERGRLWRVVYRGTAASPALRPAALPSDPAGLIGELASPSLSRRILAMGELEDRFGASAVGGIRDALRSPKNEEQSVHALWLLQRLGALGREDLQNAAASSKSRIRVHAQRIAADIFYRASRPLPVADGLLAAGRTLALAALQDSDALVRRCAAEALGILPEAADVPPLLVALEQAAPADTHLVYVLRKSIRDHLARPEVFSAVLSRTNWPKAQLVALADVAVAVKSEAAATFLLGRLDSLSDTTSPTVSEALRHAARNAPESELPRLAELVRRRYPTQPEFQLALFRSVDQGLQQRGLALPQSVQSWGSELAVQLLQPSAASGWINVPLDPATENPWDFQERQRADGKPIRVLSSLVRGEGKTGSLRSPEFAAGGELRFWLCGHDGYPDRPAKKVNAVRLRDAASGEVLLEAWPPRSDIAQQVVWSTAPHAGRRVVLEATDGDTGDAYAWLALGDLEGGPALPPASPAALADRTTGAVELASRLGLKNLAPQLRELAARPGDPDLRAAAARGYATLDSGAAVPLLASLLSDSKQPLGLRERLGVVLAEVNSSESRAAVVAAFPAVPYRVQQAWAVALTGTREGAEAFLQAVEQGKASPRILQLTGARNRLQRANPDQWQARLDRLTAGLAPADEARDKLIAARRSSFNGVRARATDGERVFQQNCVACHQVNGKGGLVGPQLTGIGNRGVERLCEDILDPNRNVDRAFRQTLVVLKDGEARSGLFRREEGSQWVMVDAAGQEFLIPSASVSERRELDQSLMPENFGDSIPESDFQNLLAFLLAQRDSK